VPRDGKTEYTEDLVIRVFYLCKHLASYTLLDYAPDVNTVIEWLCRKRRLVGNIVDMFILQRCILYFL